MDRLELAIKNFEDPQNTATLGERISALGEALMWNAFDALKKIKKEGTKAKISDEAEFKHTECLKLFKEMEKLYAYQTKMNKMLGKKEDKINNDFLEQLKKLKDSIGDVVRDSK